MFRFLIRVHFNHIS